MEQMNIFALSCRSYVYQLLLYVQENDETKRCARIIKGQMRTELHIAV